MHRALAGLNAAGVGLILSSVFKMTTSILSISPFPTTTLCLGLCAFTAVDTMKVTLRARGGVDCDVCAARGTEQLDPVLQHHP